MHPALRKGPLFTKKPHSPLFLQKKHPHVPLFYKAIFHFFTKKPAIFHFFTKKHPHFISCLWACNVAFNDKSQGSVATHLRRGEIFNWHFYKYIAECATEKKTFEIGEYLATLQARRWIACWWWWAKAVSCDVDDADAYNRSFCGLCSMDTANIFSSTNSLMLTCPDSTF